jgi:hypothetical protein
LEEGGFETGIALANLTASVEDSAMKKPCASDQHDILVSRPSQVYGNIRVGYGSGSGWIQHILERVILEMTIISI